MPDRQRKSHNELLLIPHFMVQQQHGECTGLSEHYYLRKMEKLLEQIDTYKKEISGFVAADVEAVEAFRIKFLGTKGLVKHIMGEMKNVPAEKKKEFGQLLNEF